jgi:hypothetical protein
LTGVRLYPGSQVFPQHSSDFGRFGTRDAQKLPALCSCQAVSIASAASLVAAGMDLSLVRLMRSAMNAGAACPGGRSLIAQPADRFEPRQRIEPTPRIEPRIRIRPTPRIEPRIVHRPTPVIAPNKPSAPPPCELMPEKPADASPLAPPWKQPVGQTPVQPLPKIKVHLHRPDMIHKGSLLDLFI